MSVLQSSIPNISRDKIISIL